MSQQERKPGPGRLRGVTAQNASPMTGPGTTTWLIGEGEVTVIDPGPDDPDHLAALLAALSPGERIGTILITHPHLDHSALAPALKAATGARICGYGPPGSGRNAQQQALARAGVGGGEGADTGFLPDQILREGDLLLCGAERLEVLYLPGHMSEHLGFGWRGQLFCGDLVMAWAPSLISPPDGDIGAYLSSLRRVARGGWQRLLPTHGAPVEKVSERIAALIAHREAREAKIISALEGLGQGDLAALLPLAYSDTPPELWPAARRNLLAHMADLLLRGRAEAEGWPSEYALFRKT